MLTEEKFREIEEDRIRTLRYGLPASEPITDPVARQRQRELSIALYRQKRESSNAVYKPYDSEKDSFAFKVLKNAGMGAAARTNSAAGIFLAIGDYADAKEKKRNPDYKPEDGIIKAVADKNYEYQKGVEAETPLESIAFGVSAAVGQMAATYAQITALTLGANALLASMGREPLGKWGARTLSTAAVGADIWSQRYIKYTNEGATPKVAREAATIDALGEALLENFSLEKVFRKAKIGATAREKVKDAIIDMLSEGFTEGLQEVPAQLADLHAKYPDKTSTELAQIWDENYGENIEEAGYSALVGFLAAGVIKGAKSTIDYASMKAGDMRRHKLEAKVEEEVKKAKIAATGEEIEEVKQYDTSGMSVEQVADTIDEAEPEQKIVMEAKPLQEYAQAKGDKKVAEKLGLTAEKIKKAAESGDVIEVSNGTYIAAAKELGDLHESMETHISFGDGEETVSDAKLREEESKIYAEALDAETEFNKEMSRILTSAKEATATKKDLAFLEAVLTSNAIAENPENPAQVLKDNPIEFARMVRAKTGSYFQTKPWETRLEQEYRSYQEEIEKVVKEIEERISNVENAKGTEAEGKPITVMTTPLVLTFAGAELLPLVLRRKDILHILKNHGAKGKKSQGITLEILKKLPKFLVDPIMVLNQSNGNVGVLLELKSAKGESIYQVITLAKAKESYRNHGVANNILKTVFEIDTSGNFGESAVEYILNALDKKGDKFAYINRNKANKWLGEERLSPRTSRLNDLIANAIVPDENELVKIHEKNSPFAQRQLDKQLGSIGWDRDGKAIISFFNGHNFTTTVHECGHFFVEKMWRKVDKGEASAQNTKDFNTLLNFAGIDSIDQWRTATSEQRTEAHEKWAGAFETYIMEGKAPSLTLKRIFAKAKKWMLAVYKAVVRTSPDIPLSDEVREVFDRMLASESEIAAVKRFDGYMQRMPDALTANMSESTLHKLEDFVRKAEETSVERYMASVLRNFTSERKKEIAKFKAEIKGKVATAIAEQPLYKASKSIEDSIGRAGNFATATLVARRYIDPDGKAYLTYEGEVSDVEKELSLMIQPIIDAYEAHDATAEGYVWPRQRAKQEKIAIDAINGTASYYPQGYEYLKDREGVDVERERGKLALLLNSRKMLKDGRKDLSIGKWKNHALTAEQRMLFDLIAESQGYTGGDALAKDIISKPSYLQAVKQAIDIETQRKFPDPLQERELAKEKIREALYNEDGALLAAFEMELLKEKAWKSQSRQRSIEARARLIAGLKAQAQMAAREELYNNKAMVDALKAKTFARNERNAARLANRAIKDGRADDAFEYKRQQLFWHSMVSESIKLKREMDKAKGFLKRQGQLKRESWGDEKSFNQAAALLERLGYHRKDYNPATRLQSLEQYLSEMDSKYGTADVADWLLVEANPLPLPNEITFSQYMDIVNAFKNIRTLARLEEKGAITTSKAKWKEERDDAINVLKQKEDKWEAPPASREYHDIGFKDIRNMKDAVSYLKNKTAGYYYSMLTADTLFFMFDGNKDNGYFQDLFKRLMRAEAKVSRAQNDIESRLADAFNKYAPTSEDKERVWQNIECPQFGTSEKGKTVSLNKLQIIQILLNMGNQGNFKRLASTIPNGFGSLEKSPVWVSAKEEGISQEEATQKTMKNLVDVMGQLVDENDIKYAEDILDVVGSYYEEKKALEIRTRGFAPVDVEATPILFSIAGKEVLYKGGYYPLVMDRRVKYLPKEMEESSAIPTLTSRSAMKARSETVKYAVDLSPSADQKSVKDSIRDLYLREDMQWFTRFLNDDEIYGLMMRKFGPEAVSTFKEILRNYAWPGRSLYNNSGESNLDKAADFLREKTTNYLIVWDFGIGLQNAENFFYTANSVEGFDYADAFRAATDAISFAQNPRKFSELLDFCCSKSDFMSDRIKSYDINTRDALKYIKDNGLFSQFMRAGNKFLIMTDMVAAAPAWNIAYHKKIAGGVSEQDAIDFANTVVRRSIGGTQYGEVASIQRMSGVFRLFSMFQSFWITQFNQLIRSGYKAADMWQNGEKAKAFSDFTLELAIKWFIPVMIECAIARFVYGSKDEEDNEGTLLPAAYDALVKAPNNIISSFGPVGQVAGYMLSGYSRGGYYKLSAAFNFFDKMQAARNEAIDIGVGAKSVVFGEKDIEDAFDDVTLEAIIDFAAFCFGFPAQFLDVGGNLKDAIINDMPLELRDAFRRRPKNERE